MIYWETSRRTPDLIRIRLKFTKEAYYDFEVPTFKFPDHGIAELEELHMVILLPMCALKLRKQIASARAPKRRRELFRELPGLYTEIVGAIDRARQVGDIKPEDAAEAGRLMDRLFTELYKGYEEYEEVKPMIDFDEMLREHKRFMVVEDLLEEARKRAEEARKRAEEAEKRIREAVRNFKALGLSDEQIAAALGFSVEELAQV